MVSAPLAAVRERPDGLAVMGLTPCLGSQAASALTFLSCTGHCAYRRSRRVNLSREARVDPHPARS